MLCRLSGRSHAVRTGVALAQNGKVLAANTAESRVEFRAWPEEILKSYAASDEPHDKAGAYAIQGRGAFLVNRIEGCFFNVMGLPVQVTLDLLRPFAK
jgi:septum formation protein